MCTVETKYGTLRGVTAADAYPYGSLMRCVVKKESPLCLPFGRVVPQHLDDGKRRKLTKSVTFYPDGTIESLFLQTAFAVTTAQGQVPAEMISFYQNGAVKRIFPSFGTISAFWTEKDEYQYSPELSLTMPFGTYRGKFINLMYYETGELRSVTLWPHDSVPLQTQAGGLKARIGMRFYKSGCLYSAEPKSAADLKTPIGEICAYDPDAKGVDGDKNSLAFTEDGCLASLLTAKAAVTVLQNGTVVKRHAPKEKPSAYFDNALALEPMRVSFDGQSVFFGSRNGNFFGQYPISGHTFVIEPIKTEGYRNTCDECDG
jgi:hypothetical protein